MDSLRHLLRLLQVGHLRPLVGVMTRIPLTVLVEQKVPRPPIE
jgi:hypothetical protein